MIYRFRAIINDFKAKDEACMFVNFTNVNSSSETSPTSIYINCNSEEEAKIIKIRMEEILNESFLEDIERANNMRIEARKIVDESRVIFQEIKGKFPILLRESFPEVVL